MNINRIHTGITACILAILILAGGHVQSTAQRNPDLYGYPYSHLSWYTIESEHFLVHFQKGNSRTAQLASRIAEEIYPGITGLYDYEPDSRVNIVLNDREDYSNGAAYFFDNQIDIWVPALDSPLRGTHDWMRNVISHEFTHIVQLQVSMKRRRQVPAIYFQWLSYEDVRRPDVLYGFPNGLITYPFSSVSVPAWLAEGVAQYQHTGWAYDTWDSHRDMLLRTAIRDNRYLSLAGMGTFSSKNGLERELVYNQGYAFTSFLADTLGEEIFKKVSLALGEPGTNTFDKAMRSAAGISGRELYNEWIQNRKAFYKKAVGSLEYTSSSILEDGGYLNLHPRFIPGSGNIAFLSNKGRDEARTDLYIRDIGSAGESELTRVDLGEKQKRAHAGLTGAGKGLIDRIRSSFAVSPEGDRLVFTRSDLNRYGEEYNDLYLYTFEDGTVQPLTESRRLKDPAWSPDGRMIAAVKEEHGTKNLYLLTLETDSLTRITNFENGEQVYSPAWHPGGEELYFAFSEPAGRSIRTVEIATGDTTLVRKKQYREYRDPHVDRRGLYLYYAHDRDGIFNIFREPVGGGPPEQLTSVRGGAFMPATDADRLAYAEYGTGGYKIAVRSLDDAGAAPGDFGTYAPPVPEPAGYRNPLSTTLLPEPRDSVIDPLPESVFDEAEKGSVTLTVPTSDGSSERSVYRYNETFTRLSFYPVVRFDNYSKRNGDNGRLLTAGRFGDLGNNLIRDMKLGINVSSREVIDRLSFYGGALLGFGSQDAEGIRDFFQPSRLTDLDRDLFLITEYRGLPFIEKRWSPTVSLELYNLRRNVRDGLTVEEFPCTACLPDSLQVDIAYNIWEADLYLRSKINHYSLLELGIGYSPYKIETDNFFSRELQQLIPATSTEYYRSTMFTVGYFYRRFVPYRHGNIAPLGWKWNARYTYRPSELLDRFEVEDGALSPVYDVVPNHSVELNAQYGFPLNGRASGLATTRLFSYLNQPDDFFYLDYIGGFPGMRSYPYFAIGGNTTAFSRLAYIFPVATEINSQWGRHTFDKVFLRLFAEAGNGWGGPLETDNRIKTGIGGELRFALNSYYLYPLKLFISGSYGFDRFTVNLPGEFITATVSGRVSYGNEWLFHFGLSFDFDPLNHE